MADNRISYSVHEAAKAAGKLGRRTAKPSVEGRNHHAP